MSATMELTDWTMKILSMQGWQSKYFEEKEVLAREYNPFWNFPYLVDRKERRVICQSSACLAYLGRELGFWGKTLEETALCEQLIAELYDIRNFMVFYAYGPNKGKEAAEFAIKSGSTGFKKIEAHLARQEEEIESEAKKCHLVGGRFTSPDFHLFELIDQYEALCKFYAIVDCFEEFPRLRLFKERFADLSENQFYLNSFMHKDLPFNNPQAHFGSAPGPEVYKRGQEASWKNCGELSFTSP